MIEVMLGRVSLVGIGSVVAGAIVLETRMLRKRASRAGD